MMTDKLSDGIPMGWESKIELDHLTVCATCGKRYDMRNFGQVLEYI